MPRMTIDIDSRQVQAMLRAAPAKVKGRLTRTLLTAAIQTQREMRKAAPIAVTGDLRKSIKYEVNGLEAVVGPTSKYANAVEFGDGPKWVSVKEGSPLREWADTKDINPYALQRSIAAKGTKAHPFVEPTYTLMEPAISRLFDAEIADLTQELNNG